ncbi:MAG: hypothetical protein IT198_02575 [Acidimicrobiia bacterium]|nr:hypothetical protein [Acidimicrobiia bacterium]
MRIFVLLAAMFLVLAGTACSGDDSAPTGGVNDTTATDATEPGGGETPPVFIDILECENVGGSGTGSGTIENQGDTATAYVIEIAWVDDASGEVLAQAEDTTGVVEPGAAGEWAVAIEGLGDAESVTCRTVGIEKAAGD